MNVMFKSSFTKDLKKIKECSLLLRVKHTILMLERAEIMQEIANLKAIKGVTGYYCIRLGDYRLGLKIDGKTVMLLRFLHRKDVYRHFP